MPYGLETIPHITTKITVLNMSYFVSNALPCLRFLKKTSSNFFSEALIKCLVVPHGLVISRKASLAET